jgi:hypothetical protein
MDVYCECCVLSRYRSLRRADHSSRGIIPTAMRRRVLSRNLVNEEALAHRGLLCPKKILLPCVQQGQLDFALVLTFLVSKFLYSDQISY